MEARHLWAGLQLLDRQLLDRDGDMAGKVDDVELASDPDTGSLYVSAVLSGPGALAGRFGWRRLSPWLRYVHRRVTPLDTDPTRVPLRYVADIGDHVTLSLERSQVGSESTERWVRDHLIGHIPGASHAPE
jgi:sporulation protein YlmC with PRC-barrel domain